ncbi:hypothetical protein DCC85_14450 [Paenibacillus sp. CAA11]|uniref:hypothetical protein n=1 Tax=Paenibacillus sp. CAA11 TaxID=1532905 RepID=UPI000D37B3F4|nr:hypothetical protein [Paenibacillus sp. CAA11]AWB45309.1 hypothetical protein DCC85_14450 [Paenibacillus sp. CAA11]
MISINQNLNNAILKVTKRAESSNRAHLVSTFVDVGPLFTLLSNIENQILFGRRGTGKTHALSYLANYVDESGDIAIQIDMRNIGSSGGIYSDSSLGISERATTLIVDTLSAMHDSLLEYVIQKSEEVNLAVVGPLLDNLADAITQVKVVGEVQVEDHSSDRRVTQEGEKLSLSYDKGIKLGYELNDSNQNESTNSRKVNRTGRERLRIHFGTVKKFISAILKSVAPKRLWIILDEWSEVPIDLQPYLADLLKRTLLSVEGVSVKIAAIEQRCNFRITEDGSLDIGIEIGADVAASLNLDEYMVFENSSENAKDFFGQLIFKHIASIIPADDLKGIKTYEQFTKLAFTQVNAFDEFVKASEGVPRDAINILGIAAQQAKSSPISIPNIRHAAKVWFNRSKETAITPRPGATTLLQWIITEVIAHRRARAFLLRSDVKDPLIDFLFDSRVLHVIKQSVSSHDSPGVRYNVYSIDYGCYVDLITTTRAPEGLFEVETEEGSQFVDVPSNDYRAIRRAILDLGKFKEFQATQGVMIY